MSFILRYDKSKIVLFRVAAATRTTPSQLGAYLLSDTIDSDNGRRVARLSVTEGIEDANTATQ